MDLWTWFVRTSAGRPEQAYLGGVRILLAVAVAASLLVIGGPAHADKADIFAGTASCTTMEEAFALGAKLDKGIRLTRMQLETQWDARGKKDLGRSTHEKVVVVYPACRSDGVTGFYRVAFYRATMRTLGAAYMDIAFAVS